MPTDADLKTIELGVLNAQVRIGYVPPAAGDLQRLRTSGRNQDASAAASYEIESGSIALGKIDTRAQPASAEFNEWRDTPAAKARVPAQDDGIKSGAGDLSPGQLNEYRDEICSVLESSSTPAAPHLAADGMSNEKACGEDLRFRK